MRIRGERREMRATVFQGCPPNIAPATLDCAISSNSVTTTHQTRFLIEPPWGASGGRRMRTGFRGALAAIILISILMSFLVAIPKTARAATVTVTVLAPVGGEVWSAGSAHDVRWTMTTDSGNPTLSVDLDYLVGGGPTAILTGWAYPVDSPNGYAWTVPAADLANVTVRVCATDIATGSACATSNAFDVDGIGPAVTFSTPIGGNADLFAPIEFTLSESVDIAKLRSAFSVSPDPGGLLLTKASNLGFATTHLPFDNGTTYTVTIGCAATDGSDPGNPLENCPVSWTFTTDTPPAIGLASPVGGVDWTGGSVHAIRWTATDAEDPIGALDVYLESSLDGVSWASITGPLPASDGAYAWTVPLVDVSVARVRAHVFDTRGMNVTATTAAFAIDSTPPNVIGVTPPDGATDVGWSTPVLVTFDEPVLGPADATTFGLRT